MRKRIGSFCSAAIDVLTMLFIIASILCGVSLLLYIVFSFNVWAGFILVVMLLLTIGNAWGNA